MRTDRKTETRQKQCVFPEGEHIINVYYAIASRQFVGTYCMCLCSLKERGNRLKVTEVPFDPKVRVLIPEILKTQAH